ncbi:MAG: hypothetical protein H6822_19215 [Planctomycetaceae bacterium]|nr:hypothetical protein [Planctomycetales bacterium]MCB9924316.1 hypothetical protein [Planctomycetaceae bacterium]
MTLATTNEVLDLLVDWRFVTPTLLERYLTRTPTQVKNELRRLRNKELVESYSFIGKQVYYRLTPAACRSLGVSRRHAGPLGPQAIRQYYGMLDFAAATTPPRHFLSKEDWLSISQALNATAAQMPRGFLYFDLSKQEGEEQVRLGKVYVDGRAEPASLLNKARRFIAAHRSNSAIRKLVTQDDFLFAFVTESEGKADAIAEAAERAEFVEPIRLHVSPDLSVI